VTSNHSTTRVRNGTANALPSPKSQVYLFAGRRRGQANLSPARTLGGLKRGTQERKMPPDEQRRGCAPRDHKSQEMTPSARAYAPTRSSKPHPRAPPPPRLKPGPVVVCRFRRCKQRSLNHCPWPFAAHTSPTTLLLLLFTAHFLPHSPLLAGHLAPGPDAAALRAVSSAVRSACFRACARVLRAMVARVQIAQSTANWKGQTLTATAAIEQKHVQNRALLGATFEPQPHTVMEPRRRSWSSSRRFCSSAHSSFSRAFCFRST